MQKSPSPKPLPEPLQTFAGLKKVEESTCKRLESAQDDEREMKEALPEFVNSNGMAALLAKTYTKPGLEEVDRQHAKLGDVGLKQMKRCLPDLKLPKNYRCIHCVEGKLHKFGHRSAPPGVRADYEPGECIHTDHSGPYIRTMRGARYSQLYLDIGSHYLWAVRQTTKSKHYVDTPRVLLEAKALSRRPVSIMQTDGDGVFIGAESEAILQQHGVRHERSAPYDSNTNSFIERVPSLRGWRLHCSALELRPHSGERRSSTRYSR